MIKQRDDYPRDKNQIKKLNKQIFFGNEFFFSIFSCGHGIKTVEREYFPLTFYSNLTAQDKIHKEKR